IKVLHCLINLQKTEFLMDSFICGGCSNTFYALHDFIIHKEVCHREVIEPVKNYKDHSKLSLVRIYPTTAPTVGAEKISQLFATSESSSTAGRYCIDNDGHLQKSWKTSDIGMASIMTSSLENMTWRDQLLCNMETFTTKSCISPTVNVFCNTKTDFLVKKVDVREKGEKTIEIFESGNRNILLGQLVLEEFTLEDNPKDFVHIEISEKANCDEGLVMSPFVTKCYKNIRESEFLIKRSDSVSDRKVIFQYDKNHTDVTKDKHIVSSVSPMKMSSVNKKYTEKVDTSAKANVDQNFLLNTNCRTDDNLNKNLVNIQNSSDIKNGKNHHHTKCSSFAIRENFIMNIRENKIEASQNENNMSSELFLEGTKDRRNKEVEKCVILDEDSVVDQQAASEGGCQVVPNEDEEIALVNSNFVSSSNEWKEVTHASAPGLYTLLLNADNTFTLVAGGKKFVSLGKLILQVVLFMIPYSIRYSEYRYNTWCT
ncbi:hypothetical protein SK128_008259, partial [Halocaridina rubra]